MTRAGRAFIALAIGLCVMPSPVAASGIPETVEWSFYELTPQQIDRLTDLSASDKPVSHSQVRFRGSTEWRVEWDYRARDEIMRCSVDKVILKLTLRHTMPTLPKDDLPDNAAQIFGPVYKALHDHEQQHAENARAAAREVERVMRLLPAQESCAVLEKRLRLLVGDVLDDYRDRDDKLDADADFGWKRVPHMTSD